MRMAEKTKIFFLAHTSGVAFARLDCSCFPPSYVPKKREEFLGTETALELGMLMAACGMCK